MAVGNSGGSKRQRVLEKGKMFCRVYVFMRLAAG